MAGIEDTITALETKLKQAKAKKQQIEARKRAVEVKAKRSQETRKKILLGAFLMDRMEKNPDYAAKAKPGIDAFLKRDDDRALFGMAPLPKPAEKAPAAG